MAFEKFRYGAPQQSLLQPGPAQLRTRAERHAVLDQRAVDERDTPFQRCSHRRAVEHGKNLFGEIRAEIDGHLLIR